MGSDEVASVETPHRCTRVCFIASVSLSLWIVLLSSEDITNDPTATCCHADPLLNQVYPVVAAV